VLGSLFLELGGDDGRKVRAWARPVFSILMLPFPIRVENPRDSTVLPLRLRRYFQVFTATCRPLRSDPFPARRMSDAR